MPLVDGDVVLIHLTHVTCKRIRLGGLLKDGLIAFGNIKGLHLVVIVGAHLDVRVLDRVTHRTKDRLGVNLVPLPPIVR